MDFDVDFVDFADFMDFADFDAVFTNFDAVFADFDVVFVDFDADFVDFDADLTDFGLKLVKLTISFHSTVKMEGGNIKFFLKICGFWQKPHFCLSFQEDNMKRKTTCLRR